MAAEQTTEGFPAEGKALDLGELFAEMVIVVSWGDIFTLLSRGDRIMELRQRKF